MALLNSNDLATRDLSNAVLIFDHIPKCGGVTFSTLMERLLSPQQMQTFKFMAHYFTQAYNGAKYVTGHLAWGVHNALSGRDAFYFTFLRDPLRPPPCPRIFSPTFANKTPRITRSTGARRGRGPGRPRPPGVRQPWCGSSPNCASTT